MKFLQICAFLLTSICAVAKAESPVSLNPILKMRSWDGNALLVSKDTDLSLTDVFGYDAFDSSTCANAECESGLEVSNLRQVCVVGDLNQVCSLFSKLSKNAVAEYDAGLHELTTLSGCFVVKGPRVARVQLESRHDWESLRVGGTVDIARCE